jgi:leucyl-tRNA synthetase
MMTFVNAAFKQTGSFCRSQAERLLLTVAPFAPHVAEELWQRMGHAPSIAHESWPAVDESYLADDTFELVVQVMGRVRARTRAPRSASKDELESLARDAARQHLEGVHVVKTIVVPERLVNFVVR